MGDVITIILLKEAFQDSSHPKIWSAPIESLKGSTIGCLTSMIPISSWLLACVVDSGQPANIMRGGILCNGWRYTTIAKS